MYDLPRSSQANYAAHRSDASTHTGGSRLAASVSRARHCVQRRLWPRPRPGMRTTGLAWFHGTFPHAADTYLSVTAPRPEQGRHREFSCPLARSARYGLTLIGKDTYRTFTEPLRRDQEKKATLYVFTFRKSLPTAPSSYLSRRRLRIWFFAPLHRGTARRVDPLLHGMNRRKRYGWWETRRSILDLRNRVCSWLRR